MSVPAGLTASEALAEAARRLGMQLDAAGEPIRGLPVDDPAVRAWLDGYRPGQLLVVDGVTFRIREAGIVDGDVSIVVDPVMPEVIDATIVQAATGAPLVGDVLDPTWDQLTEPLNPLARDLARLHRPVERAGATRYCHGCDAGAYAEDDPDWPCESAELVLKHLGLYVTGAGVRA